MEISYLVLAVVALAGVVVGWLMSGLRTAQYKADLLAEQRDIYGELSAAREAL
ncbi:DUF1049 domain-containing protein, partial [Cronobacter sakazakii]